MKAVADLVPGFSKLCTLLTDHVVIPLITGDPFPRLPIEVWPHDPEAFPLESFFESVDPACVAEQSALEGCPAEAEAGPHSAVEDIILMFLPSLRPQSRLEICSAASPSLRALGRKPWRPQLSCRLWHPSKRFWRCWPRLLLLGLYTPPPVYT